VISENERSAKKPAKQGFAADAPKPIKINASTHYDFEGRNLTAYGGLLPVATMLEKLKFQQLVEETLTVKRVTRAMPWYQFVLGMVLALYVGFSRLNHLQFLAREPMLMGILKVLSLPPQCTVLAFLGFAPFVCRAAVARSAATDAAESMGSRQCKTDVGDFRHRYDRAHDLRKAAGGTERLQPEEQRQEKLSTDSDVCGGDQRVRSRLIRSHRDVLVGMDFFTAEDLTLKGLLTYYVFFFIHLETRRVSLVGFTPYPDQEWMEQQARNMTMEEWGCLRGCRYLHHTGSEINGP